MRKQYESQEEKINNFLDNKIIPILKKKDLDHDKVIKAICLELGIKKEKVEQSISNLIELGKIKEIHILTIPNDQLDNWLKDFFEKEKEEKKEVKKVDEILNIKNKKEK